MTVLVVRIVIMVSSVAFKQGIHLMVIVNCNSAECPLLRFNLRLVLRVLPMKQSLWTVDLDTQH